MTACLALMEQGWSNVLISYEEEEARAAEVVRDAANVVQRELEEKERDEPFIVGDWGIMEAVVEEDDDSWRDDWGFLRPREQVVKVVDPVTLVRAYDSKIQCVRFSPLPSPRRH